MPENQLKQAYISAQKLLNRPSYVDADMASAMIAQLKSVFPQTISDYVHIIICPRQLHQLIRLNKLIKDFEALRHLHNHEFIQQQLKDKQEFFSTIENHGLDHQQAAAIITDEYNNLVIAGAGSGKTTTIVGKVKYLVEHQNISPNHILPISFTRKSADSLKQRIDIKGVEPRTFHALGFHIIKQVEGRDVDVLNTDSYQETNSIFTSILSELMADPNHAPTVASFFINYLKQQKSQFEFTSLGEYAQYLKDQGFSSYHQVEVLVKGNKTFRNEQVKSVEECMIANFLLFNNVNYKYEADYPHTEGIRYKPDFTITANGQTVYLEHFGINRQGMVPAFFGHDERSRAQATHKYQSEMAWKRQTHQQNGTTLLESYSYELTEGTLIANLKAKLVAADIPFNPMTAQEMLEVIQKSTNREMDGFIELLQSFTALFKLSGLTLDQIRRKNKRRHANQPEILKRTDAFLRVYELVYQKYQQGLAKENKIDFSDMIAQATEHIRSGAFQCPWQYIIIDEFQDMSMGTYRLIHAIREQNPSIKLFCVGDDWQSIYRFAGSDIGLFTNFEKYFGPTARCRIETTHRFGEPLIATSSKFILKNPHQTNKKLVAPGKQTDVTVGGFGPTLDLTESLVKVLGSLEDQGLNSGNRVLVIGRYNRDFETVHPIPSKIKTKQSNKKMFILYTLQHPINQRKTLEIEFLTAHRAKGLEADYVIVLNCNSGTMGFPCLRSDDPILSLLLSSADQFENGEERRLFYVAMTRAKIETIILFDNLQPSRFVLEIAQENGDPNTRFCPKCGEGILIKRTNKKDKREFIGCSNYSYGCNYTEEIGNIRR